MKMIRILEEISRPSPQSVLLISLTVLAVVHLWRWFQQLVRNTKKGPAPPGPFPWPVIGNAAQIGSTPHLSFTRMAQQYGDVFQIKLGSRNVVVLNGEDTIKQALIKKGTDFAGRPDFISFKLVSGGKSMAFGSYSNLWKAHRRIAQSTVRAFSTSNPQTKKTFEQHVISEVRELVNVFLKKTKQEKYFRPSQVLTVATANIISALCFGKRYSYEDAEFKSLVGRNNQFTETVGAGSLVDVMPWLQSFPNPIKTMFGNFKNLNLEFFAFIEDKVTQHRATIKPGIIRDMTDAFILALDQDKRGTNEVLLGKDHVPPTVCDIFGASLDTLSTALQWIVLLLIRFPEMQTRLQQEVDNVVDRTRLPSVEDQPSLPYVMAFIYEAMRFSSFMPGTIPHSTTTDTSVNGYYIPKNTVIFVNQWSVNHDAQKWVNPGVFDPTRFVSEAGDLNKDLTNSVLIFSVGKRRCIGEQLSKMQLFLYTAILAHQCNFIANPDEPSTLDSFYGLTLKPAPFSIAVTHRGSMEVMDCYVKDLQKADNSM
ncbi:cytochrome P450 1B1-like [Polyodon spathula]|uniref:cytochrome P450 1B1-like n=1 Tax=Polyodon spathula TaxID=7913 RepID=UPI001B7E3B0E|nr:cytochrome P450 1B1-like [Polyodon spathula]